MRKEFLIVSVLLTISLVVTSMLVPAVWWSFLLVGPLLLFGYQDYFQTRHTIRRNFPLAGRIRYIFEAIRPEINQYFVESNSDGKPFSREQRSIVYQRAKKSLDSLPFGTQLDVYEQGYEWVHHSMSPTHVDTAAMRVRIGNEQCKQPYEASIFNISAMSYGSLSKNAVLALNGGAKDGGFAHNTGEGGLSPYHLQPGGDLIWQIGTGYFGCRTKEGGFDPGLFQENSRRASVKLIELKISQGAKPGHGGILPARKVSQEIALIRNVPMGKDVISPPAHSTFSTPVGMLEFIAKLRELSGGKPVGFKICIGKRREFFAVCKAMQKTGIYPDYIAIDGGEGGTGAAPLEFSNNLGMPSVDGLIFVHNALVGLGLRKHVRLISTGKLITAFDIVKRMALGADLCSSARGMMLALGCIQALRCNANVCPAGVATSDPYLAEGLVPGDKRVRVKNYHEETVKAVGEYLGAMGITHTSELRPWHIMHRTGPETVKHYGEIYRYLEDGELLREPVPEAFSRSFHAAVPDTFSHRDAVVAARH